MTSHDTTAPDQPVALDELPQAITAYLAAHQARDLDVAVAYYTADATVTDEGRTYRGTAAIRDWLARSASEYTYTSELTGARRVDGTRYTAIVHLEGDFPGGVVDLRFAFTLDGARIRQLTIAP